MTGVLQVQNKELITIEEMRLCEEGQVLLCCDNSKFQIWNNLQHYTSNCIHCQMFALFFSLGAPVEQLSVTKSKKKTKKNVRRN